MAEFQHVKLRNPESQIRLLKILSVDHSGRIKVGISLCGIREASKYAAISYTWGSPSKTEPVTIGDANVRVTVNCANALREFHRHDQTSRFWIDAICIDQNDVDERSAQVSIMSRIFRQAALVYVVLDVPPKCDLLSNDLELMEILDEITALDRTDLQYWLKSMAQEKLSRLYHELLRISQADYWTRVWTFQEFALAYNLIICQGSYYLPWKPLLRLLRCAVDHVHWDPKMHLSRTEWDLGTASVLAIGPKLAQCSMMKTAELREDSQSRAGLSLSEVLLQTLDRSCLDPRDRVYGILSLVSWASDAMPIRADYTKTLPQVCSTVMQSFLHEHTHAVRHAEDYRVTNFWRTLSSVLFVPNETVKLCKVLASTTSSLLEPWSTETLQNYGAHKGHKVIFPPTPPLSMTTKPIDSMIPVSRGIMSEAWILEGSSEYCHWRADPTLFTSWTEDTIDVNDVVVCPHPLLQPLVLRRCAERVYQIAGLAILHESRGPSHYEILSYRWGQAESLPQKASAYERKFIVICSDEDFLIWISQTQISARRLNENAIRMKNEGLRIGRSMFSSYAVEIT